MSKPSKLPLLILSFALLATPSMGPAAQREEGWGPVGPGELRTPKRSREAGERMLERAQEDRAVPERDARRGAARSNADAQAKCARAVQKRLREGRIDAARRKMESCRRREDVPA